MNLGSLRLQSRQHPDFGQADYAQALVWMKRAATAEPGNATIRREISNAHAWIADSYFLQHDFKNSLENRKRQLKYDLDTLAEQPRDNSIRFDTAKARYSIAVNLRRLGQPDEALSYLRSAKRDMDGLLAVENQNQEWRQMNDRIVAANSK